MIQRYFAGDLRPDQKKSWKAEDGIFILYTDYLADLAEKGKMIATFMGEMDHDQKEAEYLHEQIAVLTEKDAEKDGHHIDEVSRLGKEIHNQALQITAMKAAVDQGHSDLATQQYADLQLLAGRDEQIAFMKTELIEKQKYILELEKAIRKEG